MTETNWPGRECLERTVPDGVFCHLSPEDQAGFDLFLAKMEILDPEGLYLDPCMSDEDGLGILWEADPDGDKSLDELREWVKSRAI